MPWACGAGAVRAFEDSPSGHFSSYFPARGGVNKFIHTPGGLRAPDGLRFAEVVASIHVLPEGTDFHRSMPA